MSGVILQPRFRNKPVIYKAGDVGPIGDVHQIVKLKHSCPEMPLRFSQTFATARVGQNVQDGDSPSYNTGAYGAKTIISAFDRPSNVTTSGGFTYENIIPEDREVIADTIPLPSYSWENSIAQVYKARVTGNAFLPLPGGFKPEGGVPRGGVSTLHNLLTYRRFLSCKEGVEIILLVLEELLLLIQTHTMILLLKLIVLQVFHIYKALLLLGV